MSEPSALIIIDMQDAMRSDTLPPRNNPGAEDQIGRLVAAWRDARHPPVFVRHISRSPSSLFAPGQPGAAFQERFTPQAHEHIVEKNVPDAFINTGLERSLHARAIRRLVIAGVSTNNSVEATARTGGNLGFEVVVAHDACFTFDKQDFGGTLRQAEEVHLMALGNLQGEYAEVRSTDAILDALARA